MKKEYYVSLFGLVTGLTIALFPFCVGKFIQFSEKMGAVNYLYLLTMLFTLISAPILRYIFNIYIAKIDAGYRKKTKNNLLRKLFFKKDLQSDEEIVDLVDGDVDGSIYLKYRRVFDVSINTSIIALSFSALIYFNFWLTLPPCIAIILTIFTFNLSKNTSNKSYLKYIELNTSFLGKICNDINKNQPVDVSKYENDSVEIVKVSVKANLLNETYSSLTSFSYIIGISSLGLVGYILVSKFNVGVGEIIATAIYVERVLVPVNTLTRIFYETREAKARLMRIQNNISEELDFG